MNLSLLFNTYFNTYPYPHRLQSVHWPGLQESDLQVFTWVSRNNTSAIANDTELTFLPKKHRRGLLEDPLVVFLCDRNLPWPLPPDLVTWAEHVIERLDLAQ